MKPTLRLLIATLFFSFSVGTSAQLPERTGWWKFDDAINLTQAAIGNSLILAGEMQPASGPVAGNNAAMIGVGSYLVMDHGITGNGGGSLVNEYTLQIDFSIPETAIWHAFFQTDETNESDGDLFTSSSSNAIGTAQTGYSNQGVAVDSWYRMIITVSNGDFFRVYLNGELWLDGAFQSVDGRFALASTLLLFADNDGEDGIILCSELGIWDFALDEYQVSQLGDATGARSRSRERMGWWKFDDAADMLQAEEGYPLELTGSQESVPGPAEGNLATRIGLQSYLKITNDIALNGEETLVNEYSLQIDFSVPDKAVWHAFFQTNPSNSDDADLFASNSDYNVGTAQTGYSTDAIESDTWYRMVISVKNGEFFRVYLNGDLWLDAPGQPMDGRFGLDDVLLIFADDDGDDGEILCSELCIWEVALTGNEVIELGGDPTGSIPERSGWWKFDDPSDLLKAEIGNPLQVSGVEMEAPGPVEGNGATMISMGSYLIMDHGIFANGDGSQVNEYTLQIDFSVSELGIWYAFIQTTEDNSDDADLFINSGSNAVGTAATGYSSNTINANTWYRMVISVKNGVFFKVYINGEAWLESAGQTIDGRFSLTDALLLFGDDDGDDGTIICSETGIWNVALNAEQIAKLGDASTSVETGILNRPAGSSAGLGQNYPNPFSNSTVFPYHVGKAGEVAFRVFDISGREVKLFSEGLKNPGAYALEFSSDQLSSGIYYFQMKTDELTSTRKMIIAK
ncbi:MAG: LamG-like jellyroll fold domain-containing protein [Bacteroidota bacterium]